MTGLLPAVQPVVATAPKPLVAAKQASLAEREMVALQVILYEL